ncbi:hypothetical protein PM082_014866 [Marasmius tenuissimus]|nr:hypothetical protein PM082_014866 [Marasmius tenuissimus]
MALIEHEVEVIQADLPPDDPSRAAALEHIRYLREYWMSNGKQDDFWKSWSNIGREVASETLSCPVEDVLGTTNHLESFNNVLKNGRLAHVQRGGRRLRFDVLLKFVIQDMMPSIYEERTLLIEERNRRKARLLTLANGQELWNNFQERQSPSKSCSTLPPVAFLLPDEARDAAAAGLVSHKQVGAPNWMSNMQGLNLTCISSLVAEHDRQSIEYQVQLWYSGLASSLLYVDSLRTHHNLQIPHFPIPTSERDARSLQSHLSGIPDSSPPSSPAPTHSPEAPQPRPLLRAAERLHDLVSDSVGLLEPESDSSDSEDASVDDSSSQMIPSSPVSEQSEPLPTATQQGVKQHTRARLLHHINAARPNLSSIRTFLAEVDFEPHDISVAGPLREDLHDLLELLNKKLSLVPSRPEPDSPLPSSPSPHTRPSSPTAPVRPGQKRKDYPGIISPSPKRASRRQESYSIH